MEIEYTNRNRRIPARQSGFNMIELMVTLLIISILTMIAYPSFMQSVRKGNRSDAHTAMMRAANNLERFFSTNGTYTTDSSILGFTMVGDDATSDQGHYIISVGAGATGIGSSYVVSASAIDGDMQSHDDGCTDFTISSLGVRTPDPTDTKCW